MKTQNLKIDQVYRYTGDGLNNPIIYQGMDDDKYKFMPYDIANQEPHGIANGLTEKEVKNLVISGVI